MKSRFLILGMLLCLLFAGFVNCSRSGQSTSSPLPPSSDNNSLDDVLSQIPNLVICAPGPNPFINHTQTDFDTTYYHACQTICSDWTTCTTKTTVRGKTQVELLYVVDEDGAGNGFGGTLRFTQDGARDKLVMFHKGGSGTDWVEDFLPGKVEEAGGTALQPKWIAQGVGWFSRPYINSKLAHSLYGVSFRTAAIMKWVFINLTKAPFSSAGCSGGSIATYYPRHWHGLDPILNYQLLGGGPVMSKIEMGCRGGGSYFGRCTTSPTSECQVDSDCAVSGGTCSGYQWGSGATMSAVRLTMDHLHSNELGGVKSCFNRTPQPLFSESDFDSNTYSYDVGNEHKIDFLFNIGGSSNADDVLNVVTQGAFVYSHLTGPKNWTTLNGGVHCDAFNSEPGWTLLQSGVGF